MSREEKLEFEGSHGDSLSGRLIYPEGSVQNVAIFAHCFTCSMQSKAARKISDALAERGCAVFRFDFTGIGSSEGKFENSDFSSNIEDILLDVEELERRNLSTDILVGHSLGGAAVLHAARALPGLKLVATIGAPFDPGHVTHLFEDALDSVAKAGRASVQIGGSNFCVSQKFVDDIESHKSFAAIQAIRAPLLVMHSVDDTVVPFGAAKKIQRARELRTTLVPLPVGSNHLLTREQDASFAAALIDASLYAGATYLTDETGNGQENVGVTVTEDEQGKYSQRVRIRHIELRADEPSSMGGTDIGLAPYELLQAGLGACTNMTLRMYLDHKKIETGAISVEVRHTREKSGTGEDIDVFSRDVRLASPVSEELRDKLAEIANKCPVHRTLHRSSRIETSVK